MVEEEKSLIPQFPSVDAEKAVLLLYVGALSHTISMAAPFLPIAIYDTIFATKLSSNGRLEAVVTEWPAQGHKSLTADRCSFVLSFFDQMRYFLSLTIPLS